MKVLDLFSGIGGFSLGLERAGMQTIAFCETDKACQKVLQKHWPNVPIFNDVKELTRDQLQDSVDVICGGFPCQDISLAGKGAGLEGARSGLWWEFHRLIKEIQPSWVIAENVSALRSRGLDQVLRSLNEIGYDAEWHCIPASAVGAPHQRDRIWVVAYPKLHGRVASSVYRSSAKTIRKKPQGSNDSFDTTGTSCLPTSSTDVSDTMFKGLEGQRQVASGISSQLKNFSHTRGWKAEPNVGRVANGVPNRVDRIKQLGNAVVPQIPEIIGRAIMECQ